MIPHQAWPAIAGTLTLAIAFGLVRSAGGQVPSFPGAVGQGAAAVGGRGGDVYHVTNLDDYPLGGEVVLGSLRYGIDSAEGPRTIVFDVGGALELASPLVISGQKLTIAGQTSPSGITLWGYNTTIDRASDIVVRYLRFRTGDFNAVRTDDNGTPLDPPQGNGRMDLIAETADALGVSRSNRVIVDHVSAAWGMDESLSVTTSKNVTVQHSMIFNALSNSFHHKGDHGFGSLVRGEVTAEEHAANEGGYTFYGNLWAHNTDRNPSFGGQQYLDPGQSDDARRSADVNFVNNVIYDWRDLPTHRNDDGPIFVNAIGNYYINGPESRSPRVFNENGNGHSEVYVQDNFLDSDQDNEHAGVKIENEDARRFYIGFEASDQLMTSDDAAPFGFYALVESVVGPAEAAYDRIVASVGPSLWRDAIDERLIRELEAREGGVIDSQSEFLLNGALPGIHDLPVTFREPGFDQDLDGLADAFEVMFKLDPTDPTDALGTQLSSEGYTNLEVYLDSLASMHFVPEPGWTTTSLIGICAWMIVRLRRSRKIPCSRHR